MKIAIAHDWLVSYGGAEKVLESLLEIYPDADIFTSVLDREKLPKVFDNVKIKTSFIQKLPFATTKYRSYIVLMPLAFKSFDLSGYDLVISNSHACAKGVNVPPAACHICYCLTPMRYIWDMYNEYMSIEKPNFLVKVAAPLAATSLRIWDRASSKGVDHFIAISNFIAWRIKEYYGRESTVIYPPVDTEGFKMAEDHGDYYLVVSRLVPQKRTDIIISAFNSLKKPLKIIGTGRDEPRLRAMAGNNVEFLGFQSHEKISELMNRCKALVFASYEDFGIVPVEAQACGRPVIAYGAGGVLDTVVPGETGTFFYEQTPESVRQAVLQFEKMSFDSGFIKNRAERFGKKVFKESIKKFVTEKLGEHGKNSRSA